MALGNAQHLVGDTGRQAQPRGVVHRRVENEELGLVALGQRCQGSHIGPAGQARHADHIHTHVLEPPEDQEPGRIFDQHGIAGLEKAAHDQVQAMGHSAHRHEVGLGMGRHLLGLQIRGDLLAQWQKALWMAIAESSARPAHCYG